jgi:hypothetical protein
VHVHELEVEILTGGRTGVRADAEAIVIHIHGCIRADYINKKNVIPELLVVVVLIGVSKIEPILVKNAGDITRTDSEDSAFLSFLYRLDHGMFASADRKEPLDMGKHVPLGRIVWVREMDLNGIAVRIRHPVEVGVSVSAVKRRINFMLFPEIIDQV